MGNISFMIFADKISQVTGEMRESKHSLKSSDEKQEEATTCTIILLQQQNWPLKCGARRVRSCETMWLKLGKN